MLIKHNIAVFKAKGEQCIHSENKGKANFDGSQPTQRNPWSFELKISAGCEITQKCGTCSPTFL